MKHLALFLFISLSLARAQGQSALESRLSLLGDTLRKGQLEAALSMADGLLDTFGAAPANVLARLHYLRGIALAETGQSRAALDGFQLALDALRHSARPDSSGLLPKLLFQIGNTYGALGHADSTLAYLQQALALNTQRYGAESPAVGFCLNSLGGLYAGRHRNETALALRLRALAIFEKHQLSRHAFVVANNLALLYQANGDLGKSLLFMRKAVASMPASDANASQRATVLGNYAALLAEQKKPAEARQQMETAWQIHAATGDSTVWFNLAENQADLARKTGSPREAIRYDRLRLRYLDARPWATPMAKAQVLAALGRDYLLAALPDSSLLFWDRALAIFEMHWPDTQPSLAEAYREKAGCLRLHGDTALALVFLQKSLRACGFGPAGVSNMVHWGTGFNTFFALAQLHADGGKPENALAALQRADTCVALQRLRIRADESKTQLSEIARPAYELGAELASQLYARTSLRRYFDAAFHFSEQSKSIQLAEALRALDPLFADSVPELKPVRALEDSLRAEIASAKEALQQLLPAQTAAYLALETRLIDLSLRYHAVQDSFRHFSFHHENYFNIRFGQRTVATDKLIDWCGARDRALASWFLTGQHMLVFLFQKNAPPQLLSLPLNFPLDSLVRQMLTGITAWHLDSVHSNALFNASLRQYIDAAAALYPKVLGPVQQRLQTTRLVIVPDGPLNYLPFDALLSQAPPLPNGEAFDFAQLHFVAEHLNISYGFSASLVHDLSRRRLFTQPLYPMLAFAPFAYSNSSGSTKGGLPDPLPADPLPASGPESESIARAARGQAFLRTAARRDTVLRYAPMAGALHFSTHGFASESDPDSVGLLLSGRWPGGAPERLSIPDVCRLRLQARRVFLSACMSGRGPYAPGEGMLSMAYAFTYAGAPEVLMTLWEVGSAPSAELAGHFYRYLQAGLSSDEALWQAKKEMFRLNRDDERLPYYWSGLVLTGGL